MAVVSVDLAYLDYRDFGMTVLEDGPSGAQYELVPFANQSAQAPTPQRVADVVIDVCRNVGASLVLLDGPQGWKDPSNGLAHSRLCERILNTPAKTGLPGSVKPANYLGFVEFSIRVFDVFQARGLERYDPTTWRSDHLSVIESFPMRAWRSLGQPCLPAKSKARDTDIREQLERLVHLGVVTNGGPMPTHDQLQALVAGLGGLGVATGAVHRYEAVGAKPLLFDDTWREGYIVSPTNHKFSSAR